MLMRQGIWRAVFGEKNPQKGVASVEVSTGKRHSEQLGRWKCNLLKEVYKGSSQKENKE